MKFAMILRKPSAYLPVAMSFAALATVLAQLLIHGVVREGDEGAAAHIFQLLIVGEVPIVGFFVIKWLPRVGLQALPVLSLQMGAVLAALAPVFILKL
jgi:hypothetical protein